MLFTMSNNNIIPVDPLTTRAKIDIEFEIAVQKFGEDHIEIMGIAGSWGTPWMMSKSSQPCASLTKPAQFSTTSPSG